MVVTDSRSISSPDIQPGAPGGQILEVVHLARENERRRLSAEIHDGVVQWMVGALYRINAYRQNMSPLKSGDLGDELTCIAATLKQSVGELRRIIADLRPPALEKMGLVPALHQAMSTLEEVGISCHFEHHGEPLKLSSSEERAVFGIAQEALNNIRKHSGASVAHLRLRFQDDVVSVEITDNGRGFIPENMLDNQARPDHIGIPSMKERAELIGACLEIESRPDEGTSISFTFCPASSC
jgi:two-component system sensor histidine kinase DegS